MNCSNYGKLPFCKQCKLNDEKCEYYKENGNGK